MAPSYTFWEIYPLPANWHKLTVSVWVAVTIHVRSINPRQTSGNIVYLMEEFFNITCTTFCRTTENLWACNNLNCVSQLHHLIGRGGGKVSNETKACTQYYWHSPGQQRKGQHPKSAGIARYNSANTGGILTALTSVGPLVIAMHQDFTVSSCSGPHPLES